MKLPKALFVIVPLLGLGEAALHLYQAHRAPTLADWEQVEPKVAEMRQGQELVVPAPYWADPLARHAFGDRLMPLRDVARPDVSAYTEALEVGILGETSPELGGWRESERRDVGRFRIRRLKNPNPRAVRFDFVESLAPGRVRVTDGNGKPCNWNANARVETGGLHGHIAFPPQRFECGGGEFFFVGNTVVDDQRYRPHRCIWAHPSGSAPLTIHFSQVTLGSAIRGYAGLSYFLFRDGLGTPVELEVRVDDRSIGRFVYHSENGWAPWEFSVGDAAGKTADVEFLVSSASAQDRHFCFYADTR